MELTDQQRAAVQMLLALREKLQSLNMKMADTHLNAHTIVNEVVKRGLPLTLSSAVTVFNAIYNQIEFVPGYEPEVIKAAAREKAATIDEWWQRKAPKTLPRTSANEAALAAYIQSRYAGIVSFISMDEAAVHAQGLQRRSPAEIEEELRLKTQTRMQREYLESLKPQTKNFAEDAQKKIDAEKAAKAQSTAKTDLALAIGGYQCYRVNGAGIDYAATEMVQSELRNVTVGGDFIKTLTVVKKIILELPDHPKQGDVARVVEKLNRARDAKESSPSGTSSWRPTSREWQ